MRETMLYNPQVRGLRLQGCRESRRSPGTPGLHLPGRGTGTPRCKERPGAHQPWPHARRPEPPTASSAPQPCAGSQTSSGNSAASAVLCTAPAPRWARSSDNDLFSLCLSSPTHWTVFKITLSTMNEPLGCCIIKMLKELKEDVDKVRKNNEQTRNTNKEK